MSATKFKIRPEGDAVAGLSPSDMTPKAAFTTDDKTELNHTFFQTDDESILTGVWECAPCKEVFEAYPVHEMMTVLSGSVTMTDADGRAEVINAGDTFFIAKGTPCTWEITEKLRKIYMIAA